MKEIIYGRNACIEAIKNKREITTLYITINNKDIIELAKRNKVPFEITKKEELDVLVSDNHQGVIAQVMKYNYASVEEIISDEKNSLVVMLDSLEDPHNLGAIARTCEISGCSGIIIPKNRSVAVNATVAKVSCGAIEHLKIAQVTNLTQTIKEFKNNGYWIVGAEALDESKDFWDVDYNMKIVLVIGSEGKGISRLVRENCDFLVKIPMWGKINSLNASISAALIIYEIRRQQNK